MPGIRNQPSLEVNRNRKGHRDAKRCLRLRQMELKPPFAVNGKVSFQFEVTVPLDTSNDTRAYKMNGSATSPRLTVAGLEMTDLGKSEL